VIPKLQKGKQNQEALELSFIIVERKPLTLMLPEKYGHG